MEKIDKLDRKILSILSKNARIAFKDVAEACDVSRAAVHQRTIGAVAVFALSIICAVLGNKTGARLHV